MSLASLRGIGRAVYCRRDAAQAVNIRQGACLPGTTFAHNRNSEERAQPVDGSLKGISMKPAALVVLGAVLAGITGTPNAAESIDANYPNRPLRFIVPFVPGGLSDILSRLLGGKLHEAVGQSVVIDNRGSAGGVVGFELGAKSAPDGYTILMAAYSGLTINQFTYLKLPYDPLRDFQPVTQLTRGPAVLVVHPSVPAKTMQEFVAFAKACRAGEDPEHGGRARADPGTRPRSGGVDAGRTRGADQARYPRVRTPEWLPRR